MFEPPVGFTRLIDVVDILRGKTSAETDLCRLIATGCVQGKLQAAYRRWDGGAETLARSVWQLPQWRSYFEAGIIRLELPLLDDKGRPVSDGRTAPNCEREIFIDDGTLLAFVSEIQPTPASNPRELSRRPTRGPKAGIRLRVVDAMRADLRSGRKTPLQLRDQPEKALASEYAASRDTVRKARDEVIRSKLCRNYRRLTTNSDT
jgi:hypothetical protein